MNPHLDKFVNLKYDDNSDRPKIAIVIALTKNENGEYFLPDTFVESFQKYLIQIEKQNAEVI